MRIAELRHRLERDLDYPVDRHTVIQSLGSLEIDAPNGHAETVEEILERSGETEFGSTDEVYLDLIGCVGDQYVGRKYYDDRSHNVTVEQRSF